MGLIKNKYLVVGANSFLGSAIIQGLKLESEVTGVYHIGTDKLAGDVTNIPVSHLNDLKDEYDAVFIISAFIPDKNNSTNLHLLKDVNVGLPYMISNKFKKAKLIYASSVSVYPENAGIICEKSDLLPNSEYGKSKLEGESIICKHARFCIIRISSMYGVGMNTSTFLPRIVNSAIMEKSIKIFGNGSRLQNYIHVTDVAEIFIRAAHQHTNNTYLAVAESSYSNFDIASLVKNELSDVEISFVGEDNSSSFEYNGAYTYRTLNFKPQKSMTEGIKELIKWHQKKF